MGVSLTTRNDIRSNRERGPLADSAPRLVFPRTTAVPPAGGPRRHRREARGMKGAAGSRRRLGSPRKGRMRNLRTTLFLVATLGIVPACKSTGPSGPDDLVSLFLS